MRLVASYARTAIPAQSLAESVGSMLGRTMRRNIACNMVMTHIVWSNQLRVVGSKVLGGEVCVLARVLKTHVQRSGPQGGHCVANRVNNERRDCFYTDRNTARSLVPYIC